MIYYFVFIFFLVKGLMYVEAEISTGEDGQERLIDTLSLIDAVMPDVVSSRKQGPIKAEPGGSIDSPNVAAVEGVAASGNGDPMEVDGTTEIPTEKSTILKVKKLNSILNKRKFHVNQYSSF